MSRSSRRDHDAAGSPRLVAAASVITAAYVPLESGLGAVKRSTGASYEPVHELLDLLRTAADRLDDVIASCVAGLLESPNDGQFQSN